MKPLLKRVHSPDVEHVAEYAPTEPDRFGVLVQLMIGPVEEGEESFSVVVCSPRWVTEHVAEAGIIDLRHHLLVSVWDWSRVQTYVERFLDRIDEPTWPEVAAVVGRLARWEFEDYSDA